MFSPRLSRLPAEVLTGFVKDVSVRQAPARRPAMTVMPVINSARRIEVHVRLGVVVVIVVSRVWATFVGDLVVDRASRGQQRYAAEQQTGTRPSEPGCEICFHPLILSILSVLPEPYNMLENLQLPPSGALGALARCPWLDKDSPTRPLPRNVKSSAEPQRPQPQPDPPC